MLGSNSSYNRSMKFKIVLVCLLMELSFVLVGCGAEEEVKEPVLWADKPVNNILLVGEGGPTGYMNMKAAETFKKEHADEVNEIYNLNDGDDFVAAVKDFVGKYGYVTHMEYFGHGNEKGLYVNQEPGVNGGLYANDPKMDEAYRAGSIFELDAGIFDPRGYIRLNGCNVANGYLEKNTLAQRFANYFDVDVVAPLGPTEFSTNPEYADPIDNANYLKLDWSGDVYMVPTVAEDGFVVVKPQEKVPGFFVDVRVGQSFFEAVGGLTEMGLDLGWGGDGDGATDDDGSGDGVLEREFEPYKLVTYGETLKFCEIAFGEGNCDIGGGEEGRWIRNLNFLQVLVDASGVEVGWTNPWYNAYISYGNERGILTEDFVNKRWYTRGEAAELTWNLVKP